MTPPLGDLLSISESPDTGERIGTYSCHHQVSSRDIDLVSARGNLPWVCPTCLRLAQRHQGSQLDV